MSIWQAAAAAQNSAHLAYFGEDVIYTPKSGMPVAIRAALDRTGVTESTAPGYFADVQVDPQVVQSPSKGDQLTWIDGVIYTVAKIVQPDPYGLFYLALHRQSDPTSNG